MIRTRHSDIIEPTVRQPFQKCAVCIHNLCCDIEGNLFGECWICGDLYVVKSVGEFIDMDKVMVREVGEA